MGQPGTWTGQCTRCGGHVRGGGESYQPPAKGQQVLCLWCLTATQAGRRRTSLTGAVGSKAGTHGCAPLLPAAVPDQPAPPGRR